MKILNEKKWEYIIEQVEVRDEMIKELLEIAIFYKEESQVLVDIIEETNRSIKNLGVKISNDSEFHNLMQENKKLNNIMESRLDIIRQVINKGKE